MRKQKIPGLSVTSQTFQSAGLHYFIRRSSSDVREGISKNDRPKEEYILMASEIQMSPDLKAYVFPKARNPFAVEFEYKMFDDEIEAFVAKPLLQII
jgi:hypothetical protein